MRTDQLATWAVAVTLAVTAAQAETLFQQDEMTLHRLARVVTRDAGVCSVPKPLQQRIEIHINRLNDDPAVYKVDEIPVAWIMIRFKTDRTPGLFGIVEMEHELGDMFGRRVRLVTRAAIEGSRNYVRRKAILGSAKVVSFA